MARAGGLANVTQERLRQAVLDGAVQRLRPKLLTEGITVLGLAPLLWATGPGADVLRPMVVPVLGGIDDLEEVVGDLAARGTRLSRLLLTPSAMTPDSRPESILVRARKLGLSLSQVPSLDSEGAAVRIRLDSTCVHVRNTGGGVELGYVRAGKLHRVAARQEAREIVHRQKKRKSYRSVTV